MEPTPNDLAGMLEAEAYRLRRLMDYDERHDSFKKYLRAEAEGEMIYATPTRRGYPDAALVEALARGEAHVVELDGMQVAAGDEKPSSVERTMVIAHGNERHTVRFYQMLLPSGHWTFDCWGADQQTCRFLEHHPLTIELLQTAIDIASPSDFFKRESALGRFAPAFEKALADAFRVKNARGHSREARHALEPSM